MRFRPSAPDSVLASAAKEYRRVGRYALSVFADVARPLEDGTVEDEEAVCRRLVAVAGLGGGINLAGNPRFWSTTAGLLLDRRFVFIKDEDDDEIDEHYSIDFGTEANIDSISRFLEVFVGPRSVTS